MRTQVLDERELKRLKMGSFLSVTNGTDEPAKLIVLRYDGGRAGQAPIVLVGKGVTFDSGGISLKQPPGMDEMKFDMTGAASVFGSIKAAAEMGLKLNVVGIVPACENMPSGRATKPGDIVRSMSGPDHRGHQHRRRRPPDPLRRAHLFAPLQASGRGRHRDADGRLRRSRSARTSVP